MIKSSWVLVLIAMLAFSCAYAEEEKQEEETLSNLTEAEAEVEELKEEEADPQEDAVADAELENKLDEVSDESADSLDEEETEDSDEVESSDDTDENDENDEDADESDDEDDEEDSDNEDEEDAVQDTWFRRRRRRGESFVKKVMGKVHKARLNNAMSEASKQCWAASGIQRTCKKLSKASACPTTVYAFSVIARAYKSCRDVKAVKEAYKLATSSPFDKCHYNCKSMVVNVKRSIGPQRFREKLASSALRTQMHRLRDENDEEDEDNDEDDEDDEDEQEAQAKLQESKGEDEVEDKDMGGGGWWCCFGWC